MATLRIADSVGRVLGDRYRLTRPVGTGASAYVYAAEDVTLRRRVAVKVLHPGLADDQAFLRRFRAEARAVAALHHPNILRVYDWGDDSGSPYLVSDLLEGGSLRAMLDRGHLLSPSQATAVGLATAEALGHAHRRGLVHRDIKPANLLFDEEGRVCIADFGLARALAESTVTEPAGALLGTARYAAPEQVRGRVLDARADIYSLALVLVEATTGIVPFASDTILATLMGRLEGPLRVPEGTGPLAAVIEAAGAVDPADRLDAVGLARALQALSRELPPPTPLPLAGLASAGEADIDVDPTLLPEPSRRRPPVAPPPPRPPDRSDDELDDLDRDVDLDDPERGWEAGDEHDAGEAGDDISFVPAADRRPSRRSAPGLPGPAIPDPGGPVGGRQGWRPAAVALIVALIVAAGGISGWVLTHQPAPAATVPSLRGDTEAQAAAVLGRLHLVLTVAGRAYDASAPAGTVTGQTPDGGRLHEHLPVAVTVSLGPQPVTVPTRLAGVSQVEATTLINAVGLQLGKVTNTPSLTVAPGKVISASPSSGTLLPGAVVALVISTGKPHVTVPVLSSAESKSYAAAAAALHAAHLAPTQQLAYSDTVAADAVIATVPTARSSLLYGSPVTVDVSKGPHLVLIPPVAGDTVARADLALVDAGLVVTGVTGNPTATVTGTDPAEGLTVHIASPVKILTG